MPLPRISTMICIRPSEEGGGGGSELLPREHNSPASAAKFVRRDVTVPNFGISFTKDSRGTTRAA